MVYFIYLSVFSDVMSCDKHYKQINKGKWR